MSATPPPREVVHPEPTVVNAEGGLTAWRRAGAGAIRRRRGRRAVVCAAHRRLRVGREPPRQAHRKASARSWGSFATTSQSSAAGRTQLGRGSGRRCPGWPGSPARGHPHAVHDGDRFAAYVGLDAGFVADLGADAVIADLADAGEIEVRTRAGASWLTSSAGGVIVGSGGPRSRCRPSGRVVTMSDHRCVGARRSLVVDLIRVSSDADESGAPGGVAVSDGGSE
jgi:hypothetical protein